jgi:uncharacterized membrane protein
MSSTPAGFPGISVSGSAQAAVVSHVRDLGDTRLESIDLMRGLVMVLMALDHVRDYFAAAHFDLLDPTLTTLSWYMTRWVTHLCAPTFIFLAGVSAYLMSQRQTAAELSRSLVKRGLWLVVLEVTVVNFGWLFSAKYQVGLFLQVIWAIGISMLCLAAISRLPRRAILALAVLMIAGHNLLDGIGPEQFGTWSWLWNLLHVQGVTAFGFVSYPVIPWIGVMALGFGLGPLYELSPLERKRWLMIAGSLSVLAFFALRLINVYGDPAPWQYQATALQTLFAFFNVEKYPPSLLYLLIMLGTAFMLLSALESRVGPRPDAPRRRRHDHRSHVSLLDAVLQVLRNFGRVPLFFYILHIYLAHFASGLVGLMLGRGLQMFVVPLYKMPADWGFGSGGVLLAWGVVLLVCYPLCRWFAQVKRRRSDWWLAYV